MIADVHLHGPVPVGLTVHHGQGVLVGQVTRAPAHPHPSPCAAQQAGLLKWKVSVSVFSNMNNKLSLIIGVLSVYP